MLEKLDNPAWYALTSVQQEFCLGNELLLRFRENILPFAAFPELNHPPEDEMTAEILQDSDFYVIGDLPNMPASWQVLQKMEGDQMICPALPMLQLTEDVELVELGPADYNEMFDLINLVQPGFYKNETHRLGQYFGIRVNGQLVSMAGERLKMDGLSELSAVCTLPGHTGKGYAYQLVLKVCQQMHAQGKIPFLHVLSSNTRAIKLYERLGFEKRRSIPFWHLKKIDYPTKTKSSI